MEVVRPVKSMLNGNLAYKEGDWNFSKPCHWYFSKRIIKQIQADEYHNPPRECVRHLANQETDKEWKFRSGLRIFPRRDKLPNWVIPVTGKKAIIPKYTEPIVHHPHINHSPHVMSPEKKRGAKQFPEKWTKQSLAEEDFFEELRIRKMALNGINIMKSMELKNTSPNFIGERSPNSNLTKSLNMSYKIKDKIDEVKDVRYVKGLDKWDENNIK
jgi:hypothetical protein